MNSRMERYSELDSKSSSNSRVNKNQTLYEDINSQTLSRIKTFDNFKIIDDVPKEIDIEKIKKYLTSTKEENIERKKIFINPKEEEIVEEKEEPKIYDINSIIEEARSKKETSYEEDKYKKLHNTEYDILKKIEIYNSSKTEKSDSEFNTDERTLIDLINTVTMKKEEEKDLLSELTGGNENTVVTNPINEEMKKEEVKINEVVPPKTEIGNIGTIDKSFYTNSMNFSKEDFECINELEKEVSKNTFLVKFSIFLLILLVIGTVVVILNYVFNLRLF